MKARVKWTEGRQFVAESGSGHSVVIDGPPDHGGRNTGPRPMEMLLMGMGSCTAFDSLTILDKARANVTDCVAELDAERADEVPAARIVRCGRQAKGGKTFTQGCVSGRQRGVDVVYAPFGDLLQGRDDARHQRKIRALAHVEPDGTGLVVIGVVDQG